MVSRGYSWLEERGSIYLVDPIAIIEVWGEEVLASTLDMSRLWRRGPGWPGGSELCWELWDLELVGDILIVLCSCCIGNQSRFIVSFSPFRCQATYSCIQLVTWTYLTPWG
jgi:riboflavin biosynthesis pyrimidine reductase